MKFQTGTSKLNTHGNVRKLPHVFTEQGVAMIASVLRTPVAVEVSIRIMRTFVLMKQYISTNLLEQKYINDLVLKDSKRMDLIESALSEFKDLGNKCFEISTVIEEVLYKKLQMLSKEKRANLPLNPYTIGNGCHCKQ